LVVVGNGVPQEEFGRVAPTGVRSREARLGSVLPNSQVNTSRCGGSPAVMVPLAGVGWSWLVESGDELGAALWSAAAAAIGLRATARG
jgi:hypothetical protein